MFVSPQQAARMIDGFMIGAVMQQDPDLEEFGKMPDEPPDDDPCWESPTNHTEAKPHLEQTMLFQIGEPTGEGERKKTPATKKKASAEKVRESAPSPEYPPPRVLMFSDYRAMFCGDMPLARHWYAQDHPTEG